MKSEHSIFRDAKNAPCFITSGRYLGPSVLNFKFSRRLLGRSSEEKSASRKGLLINVAISVLSHIIKIINRRSAAVNWRRNGDSLRY